MFKNAPLMFDFHKIKLPLAHFHYDRFDTPDDEENSASFAGVRLPIFTSYPCFLNPNASAWPTLADPMIPTFRMPRSSSTLRRGPRAVGFSITRDSRFDIGNCSA